MGAFQNEIYFYVISCCILHKRRNVMWANSLLLIPKYYEIFQNKKLILLLLTSKSLYEYSRFFISHKSGNVIKYISPEKIQDFVNYCLTYTYVQYRPIGSTGPIGPNISSYLI